MSESDLKSKKIRGVFSSQEIKKIGTGSTLRESVAKIFWFVNEEEDGTIAIQSINVNFVPTGNKKQITKETLLQKYSPEPEYYTESVYPKMRELNGAIENAERSRENGETFSAEFEYDNALAIDIENVKANFGIGLTYLDRGEKDKANNIFERLVQLEGAYEPEHKHLYNEFGINLRKNSLLDQALQYYTKALKLSVADENLHINIARVYLDQNNIEECLSSIIKALELSPGNTIAVAFAQWLFAKKLIDDEQYATIPPDLLNA